MYKHYQVKVMFNPSSVIDASITMFEEIRKQ